MALEAFFNLSIALADADWLLDTFDGRTDIEEPCPCCNNWKDLAIACAPIGVVEHENVGEKKQLFYLIDLIVGNTIRGRI